MHIGGVEIKLTIRRRRRCTECFFHFACCACSKVGEEETLEKLRGALVTMNGNGCGSHVTTIRHAKSILMFIGTLRLQKCPRR